jgi:hypothetical protein
MILIFTTSLSPRINYAFEIIFTYILKVDFQITTDAGIFNQYEGPKFSYGKAPLGEVLFFEAADLLFENDIHRQPIDEAIQGQAPVLFRVTSGCMPHDPFADAFYMVTRYEEYLPHFKDKYGRYSPEESIAYKNNFLERPVVNLWAMQIKKIILERYPAFKFPYIPYSFTPTIDIDNAYAYKHKGALRISLSMTYLLLKLDFFKFYDRVLVHMGYKRDPYDTYDKQMRIHKLHNIKPLYFILIGNYAKYDKNLSHTNVQYASLIRMLDQHAEICLHPSYASARNEHQLHVEKSRLEEILQRPITKSRSHYIKFELPGTYRNLIKAGIKEDYSMGYPNQVGYRAGIATPYYFYDLEKEKITDLKVFPFVVMDTTLKKYLHIRSKDIPVYLNPLLDENKKVGGNFTFIFHNESMGGERVWKNWGEVYESFIKMCMN